MPCESNHGLSLVSEPCVDLKMFPNRIAKWELFWFQEVMSKLGFCPNRVFEKKRLGHRSLACSFVTGHLQAHFVFFFKHYCPKPNFEKLKLITATSFQKNIVWGLKNWNSISQKCDKNQSVIPSNRSQPPGGRDIYYITYTHLMSNWFEWNYIILNNKFDFL